MEHNVTQKIPYLPTEYGIPYVRNKIHRYLDVHYIENTKSIFRKDLLYNIILLKTGASFRVK